MDRCSTSYLTASCVSTTLYEYKDLHAQRHFSFSGSTRSLSSQLVLCSECPVCSGCANPSDGMEQLELLRRQGYGQGHSRLCRSDRGFRDEGRRLPLCEHRRYLGRRARRERGAS